MFKMQILTQTDNHNSEEYVFTDEKYLLRKISLKFGNSDFKILCNIALYFFVKKCEPFRTKRSMRSFWNKLKEICASISQETKTIQ